MLAKCEVAVGAVISNISNISNISTYQTYQTYQTYGVGKIIIRHLSRIIYGYFSFHEIFYRSLIIILINYTDQLICIMIHS